MTEEFRILLVEDFPADAELELRELRRAGLKFSARVVETEEDFRRELEEFRPDVILSDFSLPRFSGLVALATSRELTPNVPFIFVSGTIGEESAIEALRNGATDYVLKSNFRRFAPAVKRAVEEARQRWAREAAEKRARESEHLFSLFMRHVPAATFAKDLEGRYTYVNPLFEDIAGRPAERIVGATARDLFPPENVEISTANDRHVIENKKPLRAVEHIVRGEEKRAYLVNKFPILDENGGISMVGGFSLEITERLRMEEALASSEERFRVIVETTNEWIWECDANRLMTYNNPAIERILGYKPSELLGKDTIRLLDPEDVPRMQQAVTDIVASRESWHGVVFRWKHRDGSPRWLESNGGPIFDAAGNLTGFRGADRDVTERVLNESRLARLSRIREVLSNLTSSIIRLRTPEELCRELCRIAVEIGNFRMAWAGLVEKNTQSIRPVASHGAVDGFLQVIASGSNMLDTRGNFPEAIALREQRQVVIDDIETSEVAPLWKQAALARGFRSCAALPLLSGDKAIGACVLFSDEADFFDAEHLRLLADLAADAALALERMEKQELLDYLSYYDSLTGLANRTLLLERLQQFLHEGTRQKSPLAVMILDVERFRFVNESLGRGAGDKLLKLIAKRLQNQFDMERIGRVGMNSFAIVMPDIADELHAARMVSELRRRPFSDLYRIEGQDLRVSAKCGVSMFPGNGRDPETLMRNAEAALEQAKQSGDPTVFYTPQLNADVALRLDLENRLRRAIEESQFVLHYQPKLDLASGKIAGVEALIRWLDPVHGLIAPSQFISVLEETGMILEVGQWALMEAARAHRRWRQAGIEHVRIAVNVSPVQLRQLDFPDQVRNAIGNEGSQRGIDIEITETMVMQDIERSLEILNRVRDLGVRIAMDDFGTGYSSLSYLARLPIDTLKIDRSFVANMLEKQEDMEIAATIVSMAQSLRLKTVAEGVETQAQLDALRSLGCNQAQGYHISQPVPEDQILELLSRR